MAASYPFMQVDAFTATPLGGNPCAIVFDADNIETVKVSGSAVTVLRGELIL